MPHLPRRVAFPQVLGRDTLSRVRLLEVELLGKWRGEKAGPTFQIRGGQSQGVSQPHWKGMSELDRKEMTRPLRDEWQVDWIFAQMGLGVAEDRSSTWYVSKITPIEPFEA